LKFLAYVALKRIIYVVSKNADLRCPEMKDAILRRLEESGCLEEFGEQQ
jgi:hypothetical protein